MLATCVVPALVTLALRYGFPESPHWLLQHGRRAEAEAVADRYLCGRAWFAEEEVDGESATAGRGGIRRLFAPDMRSRTFFACTFYACIVTPYLAIFTFAAQVFEALQVSNEAVGAIVANAIALLVVGLYTGGSPVVIVAAFAGFAFFNALSGNLTVVYPG